MSNRPIYDALERQIKLLNTKLELWQLRYDLQCDISDKLREQRDKAEKRVKELEWELSGTEELLTDTDTEHELEQARKSRSDVDIMPGRAHNTLVVDGEDVNATHYARDLAERVAQLEAENYRHGVEPEQRAAEYVLRNMPAFLRKQAD